MTQEKGTVIYLGGPEYEVFSYPAKEIQVRLKPKVAAIEAHLWNGPVTIVARDLDPSKLFELALLKSAVTGVVPALETRLVIPYLPYGRADRRFVDGDCHGLNTFYAFVDSMDFDIVETLDAHSPLSLLRVPGRSNVSPQPLISRSINDFAYVHCNKSTSLNVLWPDGSAAKRYKLDEVYGSNQHMINIHSLACHKNRDSATGVLLEFEVPDPEEFGDAPILMVDDICDGGGTFAGIADKLRGKGIVNPLGLYVTHGIFSKGAIGNEYGHGPLHKFAKIYTSDSFTHYEPGVTRMSCLGLFGI